MRGLVPSRAWRIGLVCLAFAIVAGVAGCDAAPADPTPIGAVRAFLSAVERSGWDAGARHDVYALLSGSAQAALRKRARVASALAGRTIEVPKMLAEGRLFLRGGIGARSPMEAEVDGDRAVVLVRAGRHGAVVARVPMAQEHGRWRVALAVPPLADAPAGGPDTEPLAAPTVPTAPVR